MTNSIAPLTIQTSEDNLTLVNASPLDLPANIFQAGLDRRKANRQVLMSWIKSALVDGVDFGSIKTKRGLSKPSLFKPGAEKICGMLGVTARFPTLHEYERAVLTGIEIHAVILRCELIDHQNRIVADGVGARVLKQDFGDLNKSLKMALKSAHIDATLRMAGLSEVFSQDLEDLINQDQNLPVTEEPQPEASMVNTIDDTQLKHLQKLLYQHRVNPDKFKSWLMKLCELKGFAAVEALDAIPAVLFNGIVKKIPDFAYSASEE